MKIKKKISKIVGRKHIPYLLRENNSNDFRFLIRDQERSNTLNLFYYFILLWGAMRKELLVQNIQPKISCRIKPKD